MPKLIRATPQHEEKIKKLASALYLLSLEYETYADDLREYMAAHKLESDLAKEFFNHKRSLAQIKKKIYPMIGHENKMHLFEDYERFSKLVDNFLKYKPETN